MIDPIEDIWFPCRLIYAESPTISITSSASLLPAPTPQAAAASDSVRTASSSAPCHHRRWHCSRSCRGLWPPRRPLRWARVHPLPRPRRATQIWKSWWRLRGDAQPGRQGVPGYASTPESMLYPHRTAPCRSPRAGVYEIRCLHRSVLQHL